MFLDYGLRFYRLYLPDVLNACHSRNLAIIVFASLIAHIHPGMKLITDFTFHSTFHFVITRGCIAIYFIFIHHECIGSGVMPPVNLQKRLNNGNILACKATKKNAYLNVLYIHPRHYHEYMHRHAHGNHQYSSQCK